MYNVLTFFSLPYSILISFYYEINSFFGNIDIFKNNKLKCFTSWIVKFCIVDENQLSKGIYIK